jgi:stage II sporulation protein D
MNAPISRRFPAGRYQLNLRQGKLLLHTTRSSRPILTADRIELKPLQEAITLQPESLSARSYSGGLEFNAGLQGTIMIKNRVPTRTYVAVVVSSETMPGWPKEALKAQAVLTQTGLSRYQPGDALDDSTQKEAYLGLEHLRPEVLKAVSSVWGQTLVYQGRPITPFYHASCGGHTSDGHFLNPKQSVPWLSAVACPYCRLAPFSKPTNTIINRSEFEKVFPRPLPEITRKDAAGRPLKVKLGNGQECSGYQFWLKLGQRFGWDKAPGTRFSLKELPNGNKGNIQITSTGAGHGVGLCQWGAATMARQGKSYTEILHFYFPNTQLKQPAHARSHQS